MTIADDNKFCNSCKKVGLQRKAHRIMPGEGGAQCDEHFRDISGLPQLNEEAKRFIAQCKETLVNPAAGVPHPPGSAAPAPKGVRKRLDFAAMQKDRDAGMKIAEVAKKYDCSYASVSTNTKQRTDPIPAITISGLPNKKKEPPAGVIGQYSRVIADLKEKRMYLQAEIEKLDIAIRTLGELT